MKQRRIRFRLVTLLVLTLLVSCGLGFYRLRVVQFQAAQARGDALGRLFDSVCDDSYFLRADSDAGLDPAVSDTWSDWIQGRFPSQRWLPSV